MSQAAFHRAHVAAKCCPSATAYGRQSGIALVVALAVVLVIASLLMVFARQMQTEAIASRNYVQAMQARWIARGVVRAIIADLVQSRAAGEPPALTLIDAEAGQMGDGLYWILQPQADTDREWGFGLVSEGGKVNLNTAPLDMLLPLPQMTSDLAGGIIDWRDADSDISESGAESAYYLSRSSPYNAKNDAFETVDELLLVHDADVAVLDGEDRNRNGVLDAHENDAALSHPQDNADGRLERGLRPYVTVYSREPNTTLAGQPRVNINQAPLPEISSVLQTALEAGRADAIAQQLVAARPMRNLLDGYLRVGVTLDEAEAIGDLLTTRQDDVLTGLIDASVASAVVLDALPGLTPGDGEKIVAARAGLTSPPRSLMWLVDAVRQDKAVAAADVLTTRTYQFSADIVAISGDGRAFYRLQVVIDLADADDNTRPRIVYVRDLTALGWPLDPQILKAIRSGMTAEEVARTFRSGVGS